MIQTIINQQPETLELPTGAILLDIIREKLQLKGTKEACREGDCGSCMVLWGKPINGIMKYQAVNSCLFAIAEANRSHIVTIEGINGSALNPIQELIIEEGASQCGFCTPGFIISMLAYFLSAKTIDLKSAIASLSGNICRCTGYASIIRVVEGLCSLPNPEAFEASFESKRVEFLVEIGFLPAYFLQIPQMIDSIPNPEQTIPPTSATVLMGGGTDLYIQKEDETSVSEVYCTGMNDELKGIYISDNKCFIGSATTVTELAENELIEQIIPGFSKTIALISCPSIRNRATLGGNLVNASPIGDLTIIFLAMNATVVLRDKNNIREVALSDFFLDYKKLDKKPDEYMESLFFPIPKHKILFNFEKVSKRIHLDIASVNSAVMIELNDGIIENICLSAGGVAPIPLSLIKTADFLKKKENSLSNFKKAAEIAMTEIKPISDVRGTAEYKKLLLKQLILLHYTELFPKEIGIQN